MSNSSFVGTVKKNCQSLMSIFSRRDSNAELRPHRRQNAFNITGYRRPKIHTLLAQKDTVVKLIELYRQNECLWNPNCPDYKRAEFQENVWQNIANSLGLGENVPVVQVKRKVHSLRNRWELETKRIQKSIVDGGNELYLPKLFYYPDFAFLNRVSNETEDDSKSNRMHSGSEQTVQADEEVERAPETPKWYRHITVKHEATQAFPESSAEISNIIESHGHCDTNTTVTTISEPYDSYCNYELEVKNDFLATNKALHIANLCEVIKMDLEATSDELFFEAKWKILDVLRDTQLKELRERTAHLQRADPELIVDPTSTEEQSKSHNLNSSSL